MYNKLTFFLFSKGIAWVTRPEAREKVREDKAFPAHPRPPKLWKSKKAKPDDKLCIDKQLGEMEQNEAVGKPELMYSQGVTSNEDRRRARNRGA